MERCKDFRTTIDHQELLAALAIYDADALADPGLPCWPCYRDGFETPNPNPSKGSE